MPNEIGGEHMEGKGKGILYNSQVKKKVIKTVN